MMDGSLDRQTIFADGLWNREDKLHYRMNPSDSKEARAPFGAACCYGQKLGLRFCRAKKRERSFFWFSASS